MSRRDRTQTSLLLYASSSSSECEERSGSAERSKCLPLLSSSTSNSFLQFLLRISQSKGNFTPIFSREGRFIPRKELTSDSSKKKWAVKSCRVCGLPSGHTMKEQAGMRYFFVFQFTLPSSGFIATLVSLLGCSKSVTTRQPARTLLPREEAYLPLSRVSIPVFPTTFWPTLENWRRTFFLYFLLVRHPIFCFCRLGKTPLFALLLTLYVNVHALPKF